MNTLRHFYYKLKNELDETFHHLPKELFKPSRPWMEIGQLFLRWSVLAFAGSLTVYKLQETLWHLSYFEKAASQGVSPELWNVIGGIGLFLIALAIMFARSKFMAFQLSRLASGFLITAFEMGLMGLGIMVAQVFSVEDQLMLQSWRTWLFGAAVVLLLCIVLIINTVLWYLARIIYDPDNKKPSKLLDRAAEFPVHRTVLVGMFFMVLTVFSFSRSG